MINLSNIQLLRTLARSQAFVISLVKEKYCNNAIVPFSDWVVCCPKEIFLPLESVPLFTLLDIIASLTPIFSRSKPCTMQRPYNFRDCCLIKSSNTKFNYIV